MATIKSFSDEIWKDVVGWEGHQDLRFCFAGIKNIW